MPDAITRLYRVCAPSEPVSPEDRRYVNCDDVRGENLAREYARSLRRADPARPEVKVFAGHRGVGKTSELRRLKGMLEEGERPFSVVLADVSESLDLNDIDFPDLLVFFAAELQRHFADIHLPGFTGESRLLRRLWDDLVNVLGKEVDLTGADVGVPYASLAVELKNRPNARVELRQAIERQSTSILHAVNDLLDEATVALRQNGFEGVVLIVDGLDKVIRRNLPDEACNTHERLFIHRAEHLASLRAHVVYTVPISLIYAPEFTQLEQTFGGHQVSVPMIRVRGEQREEATADTAGIRKLREILEARCRVAEVELQEVFDSEETCTHLCAMTGGHPRHLMMFLRAALDQVDTLPLSRAAVEKAIRDYANSLLREMPDEFWEPLRKFREPQDTIAKDDIHQRMLLLLHVFEYMNGRPWYEVNPVLRTLPKFAG